MKPTLSKSKNARGRVLAHVATIGPITRQGATPEEAAELCEAATLDALARLFQGTEIRRWRGHMAIIAPTSEGWCYWLSTAAGEGIANYVGPDRAKAIVSALHHLAQNAWTPDVDDQEFLAVFRSPKRLRDGSAFSGGTSRRKRWAITDAEAHRIA